MKSSILALALPVLAALSTACGGREEIVVSGTPPADQPSQEDQSHDDGSHEHSFVGADVKSSRTRVGGTVMVGYVSIDLWLNHGDAKAGAHTHAVVKLEYNDKGATRVRAWVGGEDRTRSLVALGEYDASQDEYLLHVEAPEALPEMTRFWVEIEGPEGAKHAGGAWPLLK